MTGAWPAGRDGWTIVLVSLPEEAAAPPPRRRRGEPGPAASPRPASSGSSDFASLNPGYYVVFAGVFDSLDAATRALPDARAAFSTAYTRRVSR